MKDRMIAVCSPRLLQRRRIPKSLTEIASYPILEDPVYRYWARYARCVGQQLDLTEAIHYDDSGVIVEAAVNGQGMAMARGSLAAAALSSGQLVKLFDADFSEKLGYYDIILCFRQAIRCVAV